MKTLMAAILLIAGQAQSGALTIIRDYMGGIPPTNSIGGGNLVDIFNAACDYWQAIIKDDYTVTIHYGWSNVTGHVLLNQGGFPNRETEGTITFQANGLAGTFLYYLDPKPYENEEYTNFLSLSDDLGTGNMPCWRYLTGGPVGDTGNYLDLVTVARYEVSHALGLSFNNNSFQDNIIWTNGLPFIPIRAPLPYAGCLMPLRTNNSGVMANLDYVHGYGVLSGGSFAPGQRVMASTIDVLALAQISGFTNIDWSAVEGGATLPVLNISSQAAGAQVQSVSQPATATLSWNAPLFGTFEVQQCSGLQSGWVTIPAAIAESNGVYSASVPVSSGNAFFRLKQVLP